MDAYAVNEGLFSRLVSTAISYWVRQVRPTEVSFSASSARRNLDEVVVIQDKTEFDDLMKIIGPEVKKQGDERVHDVGDFVKAPYAYAFYGRILIVCPGTDATPSTGRR